MSLVFCTKHDRDDSGALCFVNPDGNHVNPRACTCGSYKEDAKYRQVKDFPEFVLKYQDAQGNLTVHTIPMDEWKKYNKKRFGKIDPGCPIDDEHDPIPKSWKV